MKKDIQNLMKQKDVDAIIVSGGSEHNPPMTYLAKGEFFTKAIIVLLKDREPVLFYRPMERDNAAKTGMKKICFDEFPTETYLREWDGDQAKADALELRDILNRVGLRNGKIAFCGKTEFGTQYAMVQAFRELVPEFEILGSEGIDVINQARFTKDLEEIEAIRKMGLTVTEVVRRVENFIKDDCRIKGNLLVGKDGEEITIGDIKRKINLWLSELGGENPEGTIFSVGKDSAVPHNSGDDNQTIETGKTIVFDFFPCEMGGGYFYDFTRTWCIGKASDNLLNAYKQVKVVHDAIINSIEVGKPLKELQKQTCEMFEKMGHKTVLNSPHTLEGYVHSISHGLGLNIHERPFSGFSAPDSDRAEIGTVFTVEPGLYYPEAKEPFGIRIEDTVFIDHNGKANIIAPYPYEFVLDVAPYSDKNAEEGHDK